MAYQYSNREYALMVRAYIMSGENVAAGLRLYRELYPNERQPSHETMLGAWQRLLDHGQFRTPSHAQGRSGTSYSQELYDDVVQYFEEDPRRSTREGARHFQVSQYCIWKIISSEMHPFHYRKVQELSDSDRQPRVSFCEWVLANPNANILFTDESLFTRIGIFNSHNEHYWSYVNPKLSKRHSYQHRFSLNVWAGVFNDTIIGPYFIEGRLNGESYLRILQEMLPTIMDEVPLAYLHSLYFQHDGAPPHYHSAVRAYLNGEFGARWIGRGGPVPWPARSPDLTPVDFYLWSEIKRRVFVSEPTSVGDLRNRIIAAFEDVRAQRNVLISLKNNLRKRARLCIAERGGHFEKILQYV
ncbi:hypothetical protein ABMA28_007535 [Loxostege sticticalis]|uniref:DUF4817 domain-containing protein n=1 Tax=Loxostege sticticalis TaxID=481309 RepID=A0ABD0SHW5_LOXSC